MVVRRIVRGLLCCLLVLVPVRARGAEGPLSLEEAVRLSLAHNERSLRAPLRVDAAQGQLERARSAFLPSLVASGQGTFRPPLEPNARVFSNNTTLTLNQPLFNPSAFPLYAQARHSLESERWGAVQDKRLLSLDTARAFLVVLTNERVLEAAQRRLERARANQHASEARAASQLAGSNDVTRALLETAAAAQQVAQAQGNLARAYLSLGFLVGKPVAGPLAPPDRTTRAAETGAFRAEDLVRAAEERRPDVRAAKERTAALRASAEEPLWRLAPTLGVTAQMRLIIDPRPPERLHDESVQLGLTWNIYDAGSRYADRRTRVAQAASQALEERQLRRSVATDIGLALASLKAARDVFKITDEALAAAQRNTAETELLYQQGLARAIELIDANARRFEAEVSRATARLSMQQAYLELRFAMGLDPVGDDQQGGAPPKEGTP